MRTLGQSGNSLLAKDGERGRNRTFNLLIKSQLLCQLSYAPEPFDFIDLWEADREGFLGTFTKLSLWSRRVRRAAWHSSRRPY
jgi:hypothetical protein